MRPCSTSSDLSGRAGINEVGNQYPQRGSVWALPMTHGGGLSHLVTRVRVPHRVQPKGLGRLKAAEKGQVALVLAAR